MSTPLYALKTQKKIPKIEKKERTVTKVEVLPYALTTIVISPERKPAKIRITKEDYKLSCDDDLQNYFFFDAETNEKLGFLTTVVSDVNGLKKARINGCIPYY